MIRNIIIALIMLFTINTFGQQADDIIGKYHLPNNLDVEIFKVNNKYQGKIIALNGYQDGQTIDFKNPEESKQNDLLIGKIIITDLEYDSVEKQWINGSMYGPEKGIYLNLKVTEIRKSEIEIVGSKYLFWRTLVWQKLAN